MQDGDITSDPTANEILTPDSQKQEIQKPVTQPASQEKSYERPEQPIGRAPRNPLESLHNFSLGLKQGTEQLAGVASDFLSNKHEKMESGELDPEGARDKWRKEWGRIARRPEVRQEAEKHIARETWRGLIDPFKDDNGNFSFYHALWEDPAGALNSLYFAKDLVGGITKASAKAAGGISREAMSVAEASKLGKMNFADKMLRSGEQISKFSPMSQGAGKLADLALRRTPLGDILGIGPETKGISALIGNIKAEEDIAAHERALSHARHILSPAEADQVVNMLDLGRAEDFANATPRAKAYYQTYLDKLQGPMERDLTESGFLTEQQKLGAKAQQASYRLYGNMDHVPEMLEKMKAGQINPTYRHFATKKGGWFDALDKLIKENTGAQGTVGFLESRKGGGDYIKNPVEAALVQNDVYRQFKIRKRMVDEVVAHLQQKGLARAIGNAKELKLGENIVPVDFWKKYLETGQRAAAVAIAEKTAGATNAAAMGKALESVMNDKAALGVINHANDIAMPAYAARHLAMELGIPGALGRTYDKMMQYWKQGVTVFKPSYWLNVAAGNGVLAAIHGVRLDDAFRAYKYRDLLPAELRSSIQTVMRPGQGPISRRYNVVANTLGKLDGALHKTMVHAPIYATNVEDFRKAAQEASNNLRTAGASYFATHDIVNDPQKWLKMVSAGPGDYAKALDNKVLYQEQLARSIPELVEKQKALKSAENTMAAAQKEIDAYQGATQGGSGWQNLQDALAVRAKAADEAINLEAPIKAKQAELLEQAQKLGMVKESIPQIERVRQIAEAAIEPLNNFGGDYNRMHPLERTVFRRFVPFYAWSKAMTKLVATLPYTYPTKTFLWNRWSQMMADASSEEHHPAWLQGAVPIFDCSDGDTLYMRPFWNPLERTTTTRFGNTEIPNILDLWSAHPILKIGMDLKGGIDSYSMRPFAAPINGVRRDTGEVYRLDPSGKMDKIIAQPELVRSLYHLFPYSQYIDALLLRAKQTQQGWAGSPDPIRDPDGSISHPTTLAQNMRDMFTPFRTADFDKADAMELKNQAGVIKDYKKAIMKERDEEKRDKMLTILQDYVDKWVTKQDTTPPLERRKTKQWK